eukprot:916079-Pyramimonas_sp.AAC.1
MEMEEKPQEVRMRQPGIPSPEIISQMEIGEYHEALRRRIRSDTESIPAEQPDPEYRDCAPTE